MDRTIPVNSAMMGWMNKELSTQRCGKTGHMDSERYTDVITGMTRLTAR